MEISKAAVGLVVGACVAAGASGVYIASRDAAPLSAAPALVSAGQTAVEHSEGIVSDAAAPEPASAPAPEPVRRVEPAERRPSRSAEPARVARRAPAAAPAPERRAPEPVAFEEEPPFAAPIAPPIVADNRPSAAVPPAGPIYDELVVAADSVIGLEIESEVTSEEARVEDPVAARVTRDVRVGGRVAIPAGSRAHGEVTLVERGGRLRDRARLGVRFTSIVLADGTRLPIESETIYREGDAPGNESAAKIGGGAIGGAILGGILGGAKGAAIGGAIGAGGGTAAVLAGGRDAATLPSGTPVTVRIEDPVVVTVER